MIKLGSLRICRNNRRSDPFYKGWGCFRLGGCITVIFVGPVFIMWG